MPCFYPLQAWRSRVASSNGKHPPVFDVKYGFEDRPLTLPCGRCIGCRLERSRQWAIRCYHESTLHDDNCFLTLTYSEENLPVDGSLDVRTFQKFMKRLRKKFRTQRIRFFHCGEYGAEFGRPHYHACIFGFDFADKRFYKSSNGHKLYTSEVLDAVWGLGDCYIGDVSFESAAYVARYIMKKVTGDRALEHYTSFNLYTGEVCKISPEYVTMSRRPGIGADWASQFSSEVFRDDFVVINGREVKPPKFYDARYEMDFPSEYKRIRAARLSASADRADDNNPDRLKVREAVTRARLSQLKRS